MESSMSSIDQLLCPSAWRVFDRVLVQWPLKSPLQCHQSSRAPLTRIASVAASSAGPSTQVCVRQLPLPDGRGCLLKVNKENELHLVVIGSAFPGSSNRCGKMDESPVETTIEVSIDGDCALPIPTIEVDFGTQGHDDATLMKNKPKVPSEGVGNSKIPKTIDMELFNCLPRIWRRLYCRFKDIQEILDFLLITTCLERKTLGFYISSRKTSLNYYEKSG